MSTSAVEHAPLATSVAFDADEMIVSLADGRRLAMPLAWFPRLSKATQTELLNYQLLGDGEGIHWPGLDEDLSVQGLLQ